MRKSRTKNFVPLPFTRSVIIAILYKCFQENTCTARPLSETLDGLAKAVTVGALYKKAALKSLQYSHENTCWSPFLIKG